MSANFAQSVSAGLLAAVALLLAATAPIPAAGQGAEASLIPAILTSNEQKRKVYLVGREDDVIRYKDKKDAPAVVGVPVERLQDIYVYLEYDRGKVFSAAQKGEWREAVQVLLPVIKPHLPYLDIPGHEAVEVALRAGTHLFHEGMTVSELALETDKRQEAARYFQAARHIFRSCQTAAWWSGVEDAQYRVLLCTILLEELEEADEQLEMMGVPPATERGAGTYWLAVAYRRYIADDMRGAAKAATRSLLFENKDLSTFPYALFLNGRCLEHLEDWFRARDAHFEVGRLFHHLPPGAAGTRRLVALIESGRVDDREQLAARSIFFQGKDDIRERIQAFLDMTGHSITYQVPGDEDEDEKDEEASASSTEDDAADNESEKPEEQAP